MITSITVQVELMMYGYVRLNISEAEKGVKASWIAVTDGGNVLANDSIEITGKNFEHLPLQINSVELPTIEDDEMRRAWDIHLFDENNNEIKSIERRFWPIDKLEDIATIIDEFLENDVASEWLHDIIDA